MSSNFVVRWSLPGTTKTKSSGKMSKSNAESFKHYLESKHHPAFLQLVEVG